MLETERYRIHLYNYKKINQMNKPSYISNLKLNNNNNNKYKIFIFKSET